MIFYFRRLEDMKHEMEEVASDASSFVKFSRVKLICRQKTMQRQVQIASEFQDEG